MGENIKLTDEQIDSIQVLTFWKEIYKVCPNKRVKHLMLNGKTKRVRLKNYQRAFDIVYKALRKNAI